ncbi:MAG: MFS transporter [Myxococcaceae bacterium]
MRWLERLALHRPELRAWALYDWANSAMVTVIVTAVFPVYFASVCSAGGPAGAATFRLSTATFVSMGFSALLAPLLGAWADVAPIKKKLLAFFAAVGASAVALMFFLEHGDWLWAAVLFGIANTAASASFVFYDALLPHVARPDELNRVSTAGYALGYLGGALLLALNLAWILKPHLFGLSEGTLPTRLALLSVSVWWMAFTVPLLRHVAEPAVGQATERASVRTVFRQLWATLKELSRHRDAAMLLLAFLLYNDGIGTIIRLASSYGTELGLPGTALIGAILMVQLIGIPAAFAFGALADRWGAKQTILLGLAVYVGVSFLAFRLQTVTDFFVLAGLVGLVQGGTQALSRSLFSSLIPKHKSGEFFGFFAVSEKFAGIFGPLFFSVSAYLTGSSRSAILSIIIFFVAGAVLLLRVDVERGKAV